MKLTFSILLLAIAVGLSNDILAQPKPFNPKEVLPDSIKKRMLRFSSKTPEGIGEALVTALNRLDTTALINLTINEKEFKEWYWPDQEASDPRFNIPIDTGWEFHFLNSMKGFMRMAGQHANAGLSFEGIKITTKPDIYRTYKLFMYPEIIARNAEGQQVVIKQVTAIIEMNGRYKILNYTEKK